MSTTVRVADVLKLERRPVEIEPTEEYTLIGVYSFGKGIFHRDPKPGAELGNYRFFSIYPGDLVLSNIQAWEGAIGYATERDADTIGTHRFLTYVAIDDRIDTNWARYFFLSDAGFELIQRAAPGSVTRNRTLSMERFEALEIPLPDFATQQSTVLRLESVSRRAQQLRKLLKHSKELAAGLVVSVLKGTSGSETELSTIVRQIKRPEVVDATNSYRLLGARWYAQGLFIREEKAGSELAASRVYRLCEGDLVYNRLFAWKGSFALVGREHDGCYVSNEFPAFEVDHERVDPAFLLVLFAQPSFWADALARSSGGTPTSRNRLREESFLKIRVPLPPLSNQRRVARYAAHIRELTQLRDAQLQRASSLEASAINQTFAATP